MLSKDAPCNKTMSEGNIKNNGSGSKRYTIPRKQRLLSEDCQQGIPLDSREAREIITTVHHSTWESAEEFDRKYVISRIFKVENQVLEREFQTKKTELRDEGRSAKELSEHYAFKAEYFATLVKEQCMKGLCCNDSNSSLGDGKMGVSIWKCPDLCLKTLKWPAAWTVFLMVFKIIKGKVKPVTPKPPNSLNLEPTPNFDSHVAKNVHHSSTTDAATLMIKTQYYLYEYNDEGLTRDRPRHCLPFAVIHINKVSSAQPEVSHPEPVIVHLVPDEDHDTSSQLQYVSASDGKMAWRGLIGHKESSLGVIAIMAGHKLGLTLWKSFIEVSKKITLDSLLKVLPGDIRTAWNKPLHYRGHTFSLCMLKPCGSSDKFTSFIRSLSTREHAAGVVTVDSSTVLFLVPSGKFAVELGFCEEEEPWRMFCIVRRRLRSGSLAAADARQSCLNVQAFPPHAIEPQGLNINLKIEVTNLAKGIQELKVMSTRHAPVAASFSRSKSVDCTEPIPSSTLLRRVSDTGCNYSKDKTTKTQVETNTMICTDDGDRLQQQQKTPPPPTVQQQPQKQEHANQPSVPIAPQKQLSQSSTTLSTPSVCPSRPPLLPTPSPTHVKHPDDGTRTKASLFRFDNIPFLEYPASPHEVEEETVDGGLHVTGGHHGDKSSGCDATMDGISPTNQTISSQKDVRYHRHLQTLVPCTNSRHQVPHNMTDSVHTPLNLQLPPRDHKMTSSGEHDLSPRSLDVYTKHKETLKRNSISSESGNKNPKKRKLDYEKGNDIQQDIPEEDSPEYLPANSTDSDDTLTSGLQVIELVMIEQKFQEIDERIECLRQENAFEILDVDAISEIAECEATTATELPDNDVGVGGKEDKFAGQLGEKKVQRAAKENTMCKDEPRRLYTSHLPKSIFDTQPCGQTHEYHCTTTSSQHYPENTMSTTLSSKNHTSIVSSTTPMKEHTSTMSSTMPSTTPLNDHTSIVSSTMPSKEDHTSAVSSKEDHTSAVSSKEDHTSAVSRKEDHTSAVSSKEGHTSAVSRKEDHTSAVSRKDLINGTSPFLDEKENKTSDTSGSKPKAVSYHSSIPYCYSGSTRLLCHPPPLKARRLVNDSPCVSPRYPPSPPPRPRINIAPLPDQRFCRLPSVPCNMPGRMSFSRPPLFFPHGFPCRPPFVPRPRQPQYFCYGDKTNRVL